MKTLFMWRRKRSRTYKQVGTATAEGSAANLRTFWLMAQNGEGSLAIVDAPTAKHARAQIAAHLRDQHLHLGKPGVVGHHGDKNVITLGPMAALAVAGASEAIRHWDARLARDGKVKVADTTALGKRSDNASFRVTDAFGEGFKP